MQKFTKTIHSFTTILLFGGMLLFTACDKDKDKNSEPEADNKNISVKAVIEKDSNYSFLNEAIESSGQSAFFDNTSANITVFAPNNEAFQELLGKMNITSIKELKNLIGVEALGDIITYHAVHGKFDDSQFEESFIGTHAPSPTGEFNLSLYIKNKSADQLLLNGNDNNGASMAGHMTIFANNGAIIEIDGVLQPQTNYENLMDGRELHKSDIFLQILLNSQNSLSKLFDKKHNATVLVADEAGLQAMLNINFPSVIDEDDLENLLSTDQRDTLFANYGISTMAELVTVISLNDLLSLTTITMADVLAELEVQDNTQFMNAFIFSGDINFKELALNNENITSETQIVFNVQTNQQGDIVLVDPKGNQIVLGHQAVHSMNGSIYPILEVIEQ